MFLIEEIPVDCPAFPGAPDLKREPERLGLIFINMVNAFMRVHFPQDNYAFYFDGS